MKNLKQSTELSAKLLLRHDGETLLFSAFDAEQNRAFFASSANIIYGIYLPPSRNEKQWSKDILVPECGILDDTITALDYLMEKEALILGTSNGHIILHVFDHDLTEVIGRVEGGIKTIVCSSDGSLLAVIAGLGQLLVMSHDWEVLYEVSLDPQFLGDGIIDGPNCCSGYKCESIISWRGDGKFFATLSTSSEMPSASKLKIWERDSGSLHAEAQSNILVGGCLSWMPSGAKLAAAYDRKAENKCPLVVLFEKNGLERSSFNLGQEPDLVIKSLKWNCSSDLLASSVSCDGYDAIKIWHFSNNHWYLKQELRYAKTDFIKFDWDMIKPLCLMCWTANGSITVHKFIWVTAVMETSDAFVIDNSTILVSPLDISLIPPPMFLFTLKFSNPVQDFAFFCKNTENKLAVLLADRSLCVVELPPKDVWEQLEGKSFFFQVSFSDATLKNIRHITWLNHQILLGVCGSDSIPSATTSTQRFSRDSNGHLNMMAPHVDSIIEFELFCSDNCHLSSITLKGWFAKSRHRYPIEQSIVGIVQNPSKKNSAFIQLDGGFLYEYNSSLGSNVDPAPLQCCTSRFGGNFSSSCPWMKAVRVYDKDTMDSLIFGLDDIGNLQVGQKILCNNCNSFSFYSDSISKEQNVASHLIFTTKQDLLLIVTIDHILNGNFKSENVICTTSRSQIRKDENGDIINMWERGAKVSCIIHGDEATVILQAPRGNLECIYPRKLVIAAIANALVQHRFKDAILMVRRHRIDLNIIVDYCGLQSFITSAGEFVRQITNLSHVTEFVCAIKNENVLHTLYKNVLPQPCSSSEAVTSVCRDSSSTGNKVSAVLLAVRKALEKLVVESPARELCILTTLARSDPPELEEALRRIKVVRESELLASQDKQRSSYPSAEEAMKHLLWLSNADEVYAAALGLYDLNLAAIVALNSDKDPKEFLPFLQELESMQPALMRYTIDVKLHRYGSALRNIASAGDSYFEDCMNLIKTTPDLFPLGVQLFNDHVRRNEILEAWGDHLHDEKQFEEAATTYLCCYSFQKALKAYRACGDWKGVFSVAGLLELKKEQVSQLATELCDELQAIGKPAEAAKIALEYCADIAGGVAYFAIAREWQESLRVAYLHKREDLVKEVEKCALDCSSSLICEYEEGLEKVGKYVARYLAVRQRRISLAAKIQAEDKVMDDNNDDNVSEASSVPSGMSAYTTGSTKSYSPSISSSTITKGRGTGRQRNRGKIRAGSPGEELALIEHLKGMSLTVSAQQELKSLLHTLIMLGKEEIARKLQRIAGNFQLAQVAAVKLVEDAASSEKLDESVYSLDCYIKRLRNDNGTLISVWQSKVLLPR